MLALASFAPVSFAEEYYIEAEVDYTLLEINDEKFNPTISRIKFGATVIENNLFRGLGLEVVLGQSLSDDEDNGFSVDISDHWGVYSTFTHKLGDADFTLNVGYVSTELMTQSNSLNNEFSETIEGLSYGFSYHQPISFMPNFDWTIDCTRYFSEDSISMNGCGVGVSYVF